MLRGFTVQHTLQCSKVVAKWANKLGLTGRVSMKSWLHTLTIHKLSISTACEFSFGLGTTVSTQFSLHGRFLSKQSRGTHQKLLSFYFFVVSCQTTICPRTCCQTMCTYNQPVSLHPSCQWGEFCVTDMIIYREPNSRFVSFARILLSGSFYIFNKCRHYPSSDSLLASAAPAPSVKAGTFRKGPVTSCSYIAPQTSRVLLGHKWLWYKEPWLGWPML